MGDILNLTCSGGYEADSLFVGCGMAGPDWCRELAVCSNCCEVVTIRTGGEEGVLLDTPCPRCGDEAMRVTEVGNWD